MRCATITIALSAICALTASSSFGQAGPFQQIAEFNIDGTVTFGQAVAISGDGNTLIVGAGGMVGANPNQGVAFVFSRQGRRWTLEAQLTADAAAEGLGSSVAISDDGGTVLVGAVFADPPVPSRLGGGAAYVFVRPSEGWT